MSLTPEALEAAALALPGASVSVQWGNDRVYKVAGKMFAVMGGEPPALSFKCGDVAFAMLCEREGVRPAPYLARAKWVQLTSLDVMEPEEIRARVQEAHRLVVETLPKRPRPNAA